MTYIVSSGVLNSTHSLTSSNDDDADVISGGIFPRIALDGAAAEIEPVICTRSSGLAR